MKNVLNIIFTLLISHWGFAHSGDLGKPVVFTLEKNFQSNVRYLSTVVSPGESRNILPETGVHSRAVKDFKVRFGAVSNVLWIQDGEGYFSYFKMDGFMDRAFYNNKGRWLYSLLYYTGNKLPANIAEKLSAGYADYTIHIVEELQTREGVLYFVHLENPSAIKILRVTPEGDMLNQQDMKKG